LKLQSRHFGELEITEEKIIQFPRGMIGFPRARAFCLLQDELYKPYQWMQCVTQPELAFVVVPMIILNPDYQLRLTRPDIDLLKLKADQVPLLLAVVVMADNPDQISANLLAPIVINEPARLGAQIVNDHNGYRSRHYVKEELQKYAREGKDHVSADTKEKTIIDAGR